MTKTEQILCPVCGGPVSFREKDKVYRCDYCASPVLGSSQSRDCVNHPGTLAKGVCSVCADLVCEDCMEKRVGDYGGKLLTIINCDKESCIADSRWARPVNPEYEKLTNMDWADNVDYAMFRTTGLGAITMMIFELFFIISMLFIQYFTTWGVAEPPNIPFWFFRGDVVIVLSIVGNFFSAILLQTALQVYDHTRQLSAGIILLFLLVIEVSLLLYRGFTFNLLAFPEFWYLPLLLAAFLFSTLLIFVGSIVAIRTGYNKRTQLKHARIKLGLAK